ncbi:MAG: nitrite/sulfite reductase [Rhodospirillales bacterium]|nr:nitrite/sulfite reductase [Rhodospirillales bacterium]
MTDAPMTSLPIPHRREPLVSLADLEEFQAGLRSFKQGRWHEDRWKTFRLRFGIYLQLQAEKYMVRAKLPGGRVTFAQARAIAAVNRDHAGGDIHLTTRQDVQFYFLPLDGLSAFLGSLYRGGITTREASGNTFRNTTACPLAGSCPHEHVDARSVAERLSTTWLRHPLVQHMPRKFKTAVSGCEHDCGLTRIDDLGFIARRKEGRNGFRVVAGGGLGTHPRAAIEIFDFVPEEDLPAVQEAFARVHHGHSDRNNKNRSRIKFLVDKYGEEKFRALLHAEFENVRALPQSAWQPLSWRDARQDDGSPPRLRGAVLQPNGLFAVVVNVPLGLISSDRLDALTDLAERTGASELVLTRDQNMVLLDVPPAALQDVIAGARKIGFDAGGAPAPLDDVVACPGVATCPIGITNSQSFAQSLLDSRADFAGLPDAKIRISGCHNSCGHHHLGDIGLHGIGKKIGGRHAPHYQLHLGGSQTRHGVPGPVIPARNAKAAVNRLLQAMLDTRADGESVRAWTERLGRDGIKDILLPFLADEGGNDAGLHFDIGSENVFAPPVTAAGECAAGAVVAEHLADLAVVSRQNLLRAATAGETHLAFVYGRQALLFPARRLLAISGANEKESENPEQILDTVRERWRHDQALIDALEGAVDALAGAAVEGKPDDAEPALAAWQRHADRTVEKILVSIPGFLGAKVA